MQVSYTRSSPEAHHMGMCQPKRATQYPAACFIRVHAVDPPRVLLPVLSGFIVLLQICEMELQMPGTSVTFLHSFEASGHSATTLEHPLVLWGIAQGHSCSVVSLAMQREHLRMSSHRGSSRGRALAQRTAISPSPSVEVTSDHRRFHGRASSHGNAPGCGEILECGHTTHPIVKYRIPCTLENSTFIVSVSVEHCSNSRGQVEATQGNPPLAQGTTPTIDIQVPTMDLQCPIRESFSPATQAALAAPASRLRGSSSPTRMTPSNTGAMWRMSCIPPTMNNSTNSSLSAAGKGKIFSVFAPRFLYVFSFSLDFKIYVLAIHMFYVSAISNVMCRNVSLSQHPIFVPVQFWICLNLGKLSISRQELQGHGPVVTLM